MAPPKKSKKSKKDRKLKKNLSLVPVEPKATDSDWWVVSSTQGCNICDQGTFVCGKAKDFCSRITRWINDEEDRIKSAGETS